MVTLFDRVFPEPWAAKVPEVIALFWVVKILTTAGGEATSDYLKTWGNIKGGGTEVALFAIGLAAAVRDPPVPGSRLLVPRLCHRHFWDRRIRLSPSRCPHSLRRHHGSVGGRADRHLLGVVPHRGNALHPQHHHATTGVLLLGDRVRHVCPGHGPRGLHGDRPRPGLSGLRHPLRRGHPDPGMAWWSLG